MNVYPLEVIRERAASDPDSYYAGVQRLGNETFDDFKMISNREALDLIERYASVIRSLGLSKGDRVAIMGPNIFDWVLIDFAAQACGYVTVPLYVQSHPDEVSYILEESETKILFYDEKLSQKTESFSNVHRMSFQSVWEQAQKLKAEFSPDYLSEHEVNTLIYTSGTQGRPKGVMHTALNFRAAFDAMNASTVFNPEDRMISYLPLSHVVERNVIQYGSLYSGAIVHFVENIDRIAKVLSRVQPTVFFAVPRIWDMIRFKIEREVDAKLPLKLAKTFAPRALFRASIGQLIAKKLGLGEARLLVSGAAKLNPETQNALDLFGIRVIEGYGLTETLGVTAIDIGFRSPGTVGRPFSGSKIEIAQDGEIRTATNFLFKGYYRRPDLTDEVLKEHWFYTGDIGALSEDGALQITDRKKDIFKIANGKYVAPLPIESHLRNHPAIREVMVYGEQKPHIVAVASVDLDQADERAIEALVAEVNSRLSPHEQIKSIACIGEPWSVDEGHLTPSMKVKRREIVRRYHRTIDHLYDSRQKVRFFKSCES